MEKHRIFLASFAGVYPHYIQKAEKKGRTKQEVDTIICWLTGYSQQQLQKQIEKLEAKNLVALRQELLQKKQIVGNTTVIAEIIEVSNADALKKMCHEFKTEIEGNYLVCLAANIGGKASVAVAVNDNSTLDAGKIIKEHIAPLIKGGGGGNKTLATAGGTDVSGIASALGKVKSLI